MVSVSSVLDVTENDDSPRPGRSPVEFAYRRVRMLSFV